MEINLKNIVDKVKDEELRKFVYDNLLLDDVLLNRFRVEFSRYFPNLSNGEYVNKIHNAIAICCDRRGFIDYSNTSSYEHAMIEFIYEAKKLVDNGDYDTAFMIVTIILDSIPDTPIDDSDGSTGMIADDCIEIIYDILDEIVDKDNKVIYDILEYVIKEIETAYLYNYGIDLNDILKYFIDNELCLDKIKISLEKALDVSKEKTYFSARETYVDYLLQIYVLSKENDKLMEILKKYSYDSKVCMRYVDELTKTGEYKESLKVLGSRLDEKDYESRKYADKMAEIYLNNAMIDEYKNILYDMFYKYSKYDIEVYCKIKKLFSSKEWEDEKRVIINNLKKEGKFVDGYLNEIYIEEKMIDELFLNVRDSNMDYVIEYEKYLLPKYQNEVLEIYRKSCLNEAVRINNRKSYRNLAINVNHIINMDNSQDIVRELLKEIDEKYFRNRPAMKEEFLNIIKNLNEYIC